MNESHDQLIKDHVPYAQKLAAKVRRMLVLPRHIDQQDVQGFALIGLVEAAQRYDPLRGIPFTTFAYRRIVGAGINGLAELRTIDAEVRHRARRAELAHSLSPEPDAAVPEDPEGQMRALRTGIGSIAASLAIYDTQAMPEFGPADSAAYRELVEHVLAGIESLPSEQSDVVRRLYFREQTMTTAAQELGVDKATVSRRHRRALAALAELLGDRVT